MGQAVSDLAFDESLVRPEGWIRLLGHRGDLKFIPWAVKDPELWKKAQNDPSLKAKLEDPKFGVMDFSNIEITDELFERNLIVQQASVLMAERMAPGNTGTAGIGYLAVGTGFGNGTSTAPQAEDPTYVQLRAEAFRKAITSWTYLDGSGNPIGTPPNGVGVLQLTTTFAATEANVAIVEMGLFGGSATTTANSGLIFNYKVVGAWNKTQSSGALTVIWTITF